MSEEQAKAMISKLTEKEKLILLELLKCLEQKKNMKE